MKLTIATVTFFIVSASALRQFDSSKIDFSNELSVVNYFKRTIDDLSESIKEDGWDIFYVEKKVINYTLPVPVIFSTMYLVQDFLSHGLSNIVVNKASYNTDSSSLSFDIELPFVAAKLGAGKIETTYFGTTFKMIASGSVAIPHIRFVGQFGINVNPPISIKSSKVNFTMAGIVSDVKFKIQDDDYSDMINEMLFINLPAKLKEFSNELNELFGILSKDYINDYLKAGKN
ncbi:hypothetical protein PYW08_014308 [Mythimna loreyi]|uniref:Uncharacterized protein n=1 Tax=Mythimna loreyi TaxID=667449 RepID=A0ACC2R7J6_9NEOP|nr:hypothetical protein PYW08_014308 [Mythimna loreyi]